MDKRKYNTLKNKCKEAKNQLHNAVGDLANELQPYFKDEISVLHQPSDGFVVLVMNDNCIINTPCNLPIDEVFQTIQLDSEFYKTDKP